MRGRKKGRGYGAGLDSLPNLVKGIILGTLFLYALYCCPNKSPSFFSSSFMPMRVYTVMLAQVNKKLRYGKRKNNDHANNKVPAYNGCRTYSCKPAVSSTGPSCFIYNACTPLNRKKYFLIDTPIITNPAIANTTKTPCPPCHNSTDSTENRYKKISAVCTNAKTEYNGLYHL